MAAAGECEANGAASGNWASRGEGEGEGEGLRAKADFADGGEPSDRDELGCAMESDARLERVTTSSSLGFESGGGPTLMGE